MGIGTTVIDSEEVERGCDTGKLRHDVGEIQNDQQDHRKERDTQAEFFTDQVGKAFTGYRAHARTHFLGNDQRHGNRQQGPKRQISPARAGLRVGVDSAGIVIDHRGDETGAEYGQENDEVVTEPGEESRRCPCRHLALPQNGDDIVSRDDSGEGSVVLQHRQSQQVVFVEEFGDAVLLFVGLSRD